MRIIQAIAIVVGLGAGIFLLGGQMLPSKLVFARHADFCHDPSTVRAALETPAQIAEWSIFSSKADLPVEHGGGRGTGGWVRWTGDDGDVIELRVVEPGPDEDVGYRLDLDDRMTIPAGARVETRGNGSSRLRLAMTVEPESIGGRWGMMLMHWMPGDESLADVLAEQLANIESYLESSVGECPDAA